MNELSFTSWISIVGPLSGIMFTMFGFLYHKLERNDERWLSTETKILAIMNRLEMRYTVPESATKHKAKR